MNTLLRITRKFLRLEHIAVELYREHMPHAPDWMQPMFLHFQHVEEKHVAGFEHLWQELSNRPVPSFRMTRLGARFFARSLGLLGPIHILKFECWFEKQAVKDYQHTLNAIQAPAMRTLIETVLKDEAEHDNILTLFQRFQQDEKTHIEEMQKMMKRLK